MPKKSPDKKTVKKARPNFYEETTPEKETFLESPVIHSDEQKEDNLVIEHPEEALQKQEEKIVKPVVEEVSEEESSPSKPTQEKEFWGDSSTVSPTQTAFSEPTQVSSSSSGGKKTLWVILFSLLIAAGVGAGTFMYLSKTYSEKTTPSPTPTLEIVTPTPIPEVNKAEFTITVLNGSGITGEAKKVQTLLEESGFTVEKAGNADKSSYKETIVQAKATVSALFIEALEKELGKTYMVGLSETLDEKNTSDVIVVIGKEKASSE